MDFYIFTEYLCILLLYVRYYLFSKCLYKNTLYVYYIDFFDRNRFIEIYHLALLSYFIYLQVPLVSDTSSEVLLSLYLPGFPTLTTVIYNT